MAALDFLAKLPQPQSQLWDEITSSSSPDHTEQCATYPSEHQRVTRVIECLLEADDEEVRLVMRVRVGLRLRRRPRLRPRRRLRLRLRLKLEQVCFGLPCLLAHAPPLPHPQPTPLPRL